MLGGVDRVAELRARVDELEGRVQGLERLRGSELLDGLVRAFREAVFREAEIVAADDSGDACDCGFCTPGERAA